MATEGFHLPIFATGLCLPAKLEMTALTPGVMSAQCQSSSHKPPYPTWPPPTPPTIRGPSLTPSTSPWTWTGRRGAASSPAPGLHWCRGEGLKGRGGLCWRTSETGESQQTFRTSKISLVAKFNYCITWLIEDSSNVNLVLVSQDIKYAMVNLIFWFMSLREREAVRFHYITSCVCD